MPALLNINLKKLVHNLEYLAALSPSSKLMPVLKADAYGHGAVALAMFLKKLNLSYIAFSNTKEALPVLKAGYDLPIIILGANEPDNVLHGLKLGLTVSLNSISALKALENFDLSNIKQPKVHIKIDLGMNRSGIREDELEHFCDLLKPILKRFPHLVCEAAYSHLVYADEALHPFNLQQIKRFKQTLNVCEARLQIKLKSHLQNSAGVINFKDCGFDWIRPGISIYGVCPVGGAKHDLQPILSWSAPVIKINQLQPGETVSYNGTWQADRPVKIATALVGYGDGLDIRGSNGIFSFIVNGKLCPIVGRICMDMTMFNADFVDVAVGDFVTIIGKNGSHQILADDLAGLTNTISYHVLTSLSLRCERRYAL